MTNLTRRASLGLGAAAAALGVMGSPASANAADTSGKGAPSDEALARSLPGDFRSRFATVNGVRMHYVVGGKGAPLVLVGGWPQTWWEFHKILPALAKRYRVIVVEMRGQGGTAKPASGYDKKTMAADIRALVRHLGYDKVNIVGHDIGAMVVFSFAANHPEATAKVALLDVTHPDENLYRLTLIPQLGQEPLPRGGYLWWFAFNQVPGLPEQLLAGRSRLLTDWMFDNILFDKASIDELSRRIYAAAYSRPDAIRAGNGWYQAFPRDIEDQKAYGKITVPMLGLGGAYSGYEIMKYVLPEKGTNVRVEKVDDSGHFLPEEQPATVVRLLTDFFGG
jgi:pimeloyl-ACP methyl ester carboxylesterase